MSEKHDEPVEKREGAEWPEHVVIASGREVLDEFESSIGRARTEVKKRGLRGFAVLAVHADGTFGTSWSTKGCYFSLRGLMSDLSDEMREVKQNGDDGEE